MSGSEGGAAQANAPFLPLLPAQARGSLRRLIGLGFDAQITKALKVRDSLSIPFRDLFRL